MERASCVHHPHVVGVAAVDEAHVAQRDALEADVDEPLDAARAGLHRVAPAREAEHRGVLRRVLGQLIDPLVLHVAVDQQSADVNAAAHHDGELE
jgi:hypothetical protein